MICIRISKGISSIFVLCHGTEHNWSSAFLDPIMPVFSKFKLSSEVEHAIGFLGTVLVGSASADNNEEAFFAISLFPTLTVCSTACRLSFLVLTNTVLALPGLLEPAGEHLLSLTSFFLGFCWCLLPLEEASPSFEFRAVPAVQPTSQKNTALPSPWSLLPEGGWLGSLSFSPALAVLQVEAESLLLLQAQAPAVSTACSLCFSLSTSAAAATSCFTSTFVPSVALSQWKWTQLDLLLMCFLNESLDREIESKFSLWPAKHSLCLWFFCSVTLGAHYDSLNKKCKQQESEEGMIAHHSRVPNTFICLMFYTWFSF